MGCSRFLPGFGDGACELVFAKMENARWRRLAFSETKIHLCAYSVMDVVLDGYWAIDYCPARDCGHLRLMQIPIAVDVPDWRTGRSTHAGAALFGKAGRRRISGARRAAQAAGNARAVCAPAAPDCGRWHGCRDVRRLPPSDRTGAIGVRGAAGCARTCVCKRWCLAVY